MPFTGTRFSEISTALDDIGRILRDEKDSITRSRTAFSDAMTRLDSILSTYSGIDAAVANLLAANPNNVEVQAVSARLNLLIADRNWLRARAEAMQNAVTNL